MILRKIITYPKKISRKNIYFYIVPELQTFFLCNSSVWITNHENQPIMKLFGQDQKKILSFFDFVKMLKIQRIEKE
jgi:hypothetical protein